MSNDSTRRRALRLAKISPFISGALVLVVLLSLPTFIAPFMLLSPQLWFSPLLKSEIVFYAELERASSALKKADLMGSERAFDTAALATWDEITNRRESYLTSLTVKPMAFATDDAAFDPVEQWERDHDARVWAWFALSPEMPPLVAAARGRYTEQTPSAIPPTPSTPKEILELAGGQSFVDQLWAELHFDPSVMPALVVGQLGDYAMAWSTIGSGGNERGAVTFTAGGVSWRCLFVSRQGAASSADTDYNGSFMKLSDRDPRSLGYCEWLADIAREQKMDLWILGPLDSRAVPLRGPVGSTETEIDAIASAVWPRLLVEGFESNGITVPVMLDDDVARIAGGEAASMLLVSYNQSEQMQFLPMNDEPMPQSIAYLVVFGEMPGGVPGPLERAWETWRDFVTRHYLPLGGGALILLALSLIVAPIAWMVDRRERTRQRAAEELERMQQDAHDKVYNRLSALSKRVASVGNEATNGTGQSLTEVAEDIRATVGDLQEILGDDVEHTATALATVPLVRQLSAVCEAQSARLGIEVVCSVPKDLDQVSPELGWDLQCIAEEAITNAVRHGSADRVEITLLPLPAGGLTLSVVDNGSGSTVLDAEGASADSMGLRGMNVRLGKHGGRLTVESSEQGTTVLATVLLHPSNGS